jgi:hypothetical protein
MAACNALGEGLRLASLVEGEVVNRFKIDSSNGSAPF